MAPYQWQPIATAPRDRQILLGLADAEAFGWRRPSVVD